MQGRCNASDIVGGPGGTSPPGATTSYRAPWRPASAWTDTIDARAWLELVEYARRCLRLPVHTAEHEVQEVLARMIAGRYDAQGMIHRTKLLPRYRGVLRKRALHFHRDLRRFEPLQAVPVAVKLPLPPSRPHRNRVWTSYPSPSFVCSEEGVSTMFKVFFLVQPHVNGTRPRLPQPTDAAGTVLLVEDDEGVRALARRTLESSGFSVIEAADGKQALDFARDLDHVDVIVTDLMMPRMTGDELAADIVHRHLRAGIVLMFGFSEASLVRDGRIRQPSHFLKKPFTPVALVRVVRNAMGCPAARRPKGESAALRPVVSSRLRSPAVRRWFVPRRVACRMAQSPLSAVCVGCT